MKLPLPRLTHRGFAPVIAFVLAGICLGTLPGRAASPRVVITPAPGFSITWDGNNGGFSSPDLGAGPSNNVALASNGTTAFGSSEFGSGVHLIANINDGRYGNANSWIANFTVPDPNPFVGVRFSSSVNITNIAWGRDNGNTVADACGGTCMDRHVGIYTLQYTTVTTPDASTVETGDAATGWASIGTIQYLAGADDGNFTGYFRHRFEMAQGGTAIAATGLRIKVSDVNIAIDELEVNPIPDLIPPLSNFVEFMPAAGFAISWDRNEGLFSTPSTPARAPVNDASTSRGATAFGSSQLDFGVHFIPNVNDGLYGNAHSWIPDFAANPDPAPFIGIKFGSRIALRSIAWGRDNGDVAGDCCGGTLKDRTLGLYTIQVTTVPNPGVATPEACGPTPESGWVTIGTIRYKSDDPTYFNSYLRHRFDVNQGGAPISATAIRIKVPSNTSDIDEIEVNGNLAIEQRAVRITNAPGASLVWDGNDGHFNNSAVDAGPPANRALATAGTMPFTSSDLGPALSISFHRAVNLNDGLYGNANSWISAGGLDGTSDPDPFAGLNFGGTVAVTNIAWSRDNGNTVADACGGTCTDRVFDTYRLQYTMVVGPDSTTIDTGDAATGWADLGTVTYASAALPFFTPHLRHRFDVSIGGMPVQATGIRIKVYNARTDVDEIEINTATTAPPAPAAISVAPALGYEIVWDGNDGHYFDAGTGAAPPSNRALASEGTTPFTSSDLGPVLAIPFHRAVNLNDGWYGNSHSWIANFTLPDPEPYAALNFNGSLGITNVAWSRDNGDNVEFIGTDRVLGTYTVQITTVATPDTSTVETGEPTTGWATIGTVEYRRPEPPFFTPYLRHRFDVAGGGAPIDATGLRIKVSDVNIAIDEIEVNTAATRPLPKLQISRAGANAIITWSGGGGLECATNVTGPWACVPEAVSTGYSVPLNAAVTRFYRVRR